MARSFTECKPRPVVVVCCDLDYETRPQLLRLELVLYEQFAWHVENDDPLQNKAGNPDKLLLLARPGQTWFYR